MALSNTTNRVQTAALSGVSGGDIIATFNSRISADTDLKVYEVTTSATTLLTLNSDYTLSKTLSGTLITSASVVASASAVAEGKFADDSVIVVIRETDYQQSSNYEPNAILPADTLENDLDKLAMQTQQLKDDLTRSLRFSSTLTDAPDPNITLTAAERANKILGFNADGSEFAVTQEIGNYRGDWAVGTVYSVRDIVKEPSEASILNNIYICNTSHTAQGSYVTQSDSAKWDLIVDAAAAASSASAASASASAAADDAADAEKLAITAEDIQYTLSDLTTTGYSALHYAAKAAASASGAVNAKNDAETAQGLAEGALTAIRGFYLGAQASDPSVDGNGSSVTAGDWYFNTSSNTTRIYNGSSWDVIEALPQALDTTDSPTFATVNATTVDSTNLKVTNIKAKDGTSAGSIADSTGVITLTSLDVSAGTLTLADNQISGDKIDGGTISNFTSTGIDDNATGSNKAVVINSSNQVSIGKRSVYGESANFKDVNGTRSDIAATVTSGDNLQSETALVVTGGLYNQAGTNRTSIDLNHNGKDSGNGIGWRMESRADSNSITTDNSEFAIRKVNLVGSSGSLSTTYTDAITIDNSGNLKFDSGYGSVATAYGCRAWVNFRGTSQSGTATASGLVSGQYTATVNSATQFTVEYSGTPYTINTSGNHGIGNGEGVDLTVSGTAVTINTQIRASGNVSSITDNAAGDYTVNFTTAMPDANYCIGSMVDRGIGGPGGTSSNVTLNLDNNPSYNYLTTGSARLITSRPVDNSSYDALVVCAAFFR